MLGARNRGRNAGRHTRRACKGLVECLGLSRADVDAELADLVSDPRMPALLALGVVRPNPRPGRIPPSSYEAYWDGRTARLVQKAGLDEKHPGWLDVFVRANRDDAAYLASRYGLDEEDAANLIRYLHYGMGGAGASEPSTEPDGRAVIPTGVDDRAVEEMTTFVSVHSLSLETFQELFLDGALGADAIAEHLGAERAEVARLCELVASVQAVDALDAVVSEPASNGDAQYDLVGRVIVDAEGTVGVDFMGSTARCSAYDINWQLGRRLCERSAIGADLITRIRWLNERSAVIKRVVLALVVYQAGYFRSGNKLDLAPVTQAELARMLNVATSTVCRALHDKTICLPWGDTQPLLELLPTVRDWVCGLARSDPSLSPRDIVRILRDRHGVERGTRVVSHHLRRAALE